MCQFLVLMESYCQAKNHEKNNEPIYENGQMGWQMDGKSLFVDFVWFCLVAVQGSKKWNLFFCNRIRSKSTLLDIFTKKPFNKSSGSFFAIHIN